MIILCKRLKHTHFVWVCLYRNYESIKTDIKKNTMLDWPLH
nr:MAG TPA: hypothetical protein [Bacteriophage sp.]